MTVIKRVAMAMHVRVGMIDKFLTIMSVVMNILVMVLPVVFSMLMSVPVRDIMVMCFMMVVIVCIMLMVVFAVHMAVDAAYCMPVLVAVRFRIVLVNMLVVCVDSSVIAMHVIIVILGFMGYIFLFLVFLIHKRVPVNIMHDCDLQKDFG